MVRVVDCHAGVLCSNPGGHKDFPLGITSLEFLNMKSYKLGTIHPPLIFNIHSVRDVIRLPSKLRLICGSYVQ